ncbi:MAG: homocysteine S-methyltransferase family protein [Candidatus Eremiobacteraeota bacterium]|nr:homocysteine S-methyltransferase family protein [Candidatus Eremiobacteraeota bacterium]
MKSKSILDLIKERIVLFDGAMGTQLINQGLKKGDCPEMWNLQRPDDLAEIHKAYFDAGADVVTTNTFGGNAVKLASYNLQGRVGELNKAAVKIAKSICPEGKYVAGDMGPTGQFLPPVGKGSLEDFDKSFREQAEALAESGVDLIIIETQYDIREAVSALKAAKATGLPAIVTMTFELKKRGYFTIMGNKVADSMKELEENGADVVGANCSLDSIPYIELTEQIKQSTSLPVLVQPNAGQPEIVDGGVHYHETPGSFAISAEKLISAGANIIGACCGSTPEFTEKIAEVLRHRCLS